MAVAAAGVVVEVDPKTKAGCVVAAVADGGGAGVAPDVDPNEKDGAGVVAGAPATGGFAVVVAVDVDPN